MTTRKYLHTPAHSGWAFFLRHHRRRRSFGKAIQAMIRKMIARGSSTREMSDQALAVELNRRGGPRRTVAKIPEAAHIASSNERSRFG